jgi:SWI/SNF-related matrix-associated actin-dependent regulator 1 of chromatin subfamily A
MPKIKYPKYTKEFQKKGVRKLIHFDGRALLADEMRLGKTLQTLLYCSTYKKKRPIIVVCPASIKYVWQYQAWEHVKIRATVLEGTKISKMAAKQLLATEKMIILNYEILVAWTPYLKRLNPQILIIDECHYIKSRSSQRRRAVKSLSKKIPHVIAVSGTPLVNRPAELWTTLNVLLPKEFPKFLTFAFRYCKPTYRPWGWQYKGAANLKELHRKLNSLCMIRRLRKDVLPEYKEPIREIIPLPIERKKEYYEAENDFIKWLNKKSRARAKKAKGAQRLVQMGYLARLSAELKMPYVEQWIDDFLESTDEKIILCAIHHKIIKRLRKKYKKICVVVDGTINAKEKELAKRSFMTSKKKRIFIGQINAAGVGIDLSKANTVAFVELDYVPGNHSQFEDRAVHINKTTAVHVVYLVGKGTIEESRCNILQSKQQVVSSTLDGTAEANQLNLYDELEKALRKKGRKSNVNKKKRKRKK